VFLALFFIQYEAEATHIIGGEMNYVYLGNNNYEIRLTIYRDCLSGQAAYDNPAMVGVFDASGALVQSLNLPFLGSTPVQPQVNYYCGITLPTNICVERTTYIYQVNLPPSSGGYTLEYQRCCRNASILNIVDPGNTGDTFFATIPDVATFGNNSNPVFTNWPPVFICRGLPVNIDHSATDADGDSLVYTFCTPYEGADALSPMPTPTSFTPIAPIVWLSPYSVADILGGIPVLSINPNTGLLTGTPNTLGRFVVGICVEEYRNGVFMDETKRDFQFNVVNCNLTVVSAFTVPTVLCNGNVQFTNLSTGATHYHWDFGISTLTNDTSNVMNPTYTYPVPGTYAVTLIASDNNCSDTLHIDVTIHPIPIVNLGNDTVLLCQSAALTLDAGNPGYSYLWSTNETTQTIHVTSAGNYWVSVYDQYCSDVDSVNVTIHPNPDVDLGNDTVLCQSAGLTLDAGNPDFNYLWSTGETTQTIHVTSTGNYWVSVYDQYCSNEDSIKVSAISPPNLGSDVNMCGQDNIVLNAGASSGNFLWSTGANTQSIVVTEPGIYWVQISYPDCSFSDTIKVTEEGSPTMFFPNTFTPDGDGLNDIFTGIGDGASYFNMKIFNRWGQLIFETDNQYKGWDGTYQNSPVQKDLYVWTADFKTCRGMQHKMGFVVALR
jgi:gliding motility-associated-like protein